MQADEHMQADGVFHSGQNANSGFAKNYDDAEDNYDEDYYINKVDDDAIIME